MREIYLIWTLIAGSPYDVDAFLEAKDCIEAMELFHANLSKAKDARPGVFGELSIAGCIPIQVVVPPPPEQRKESM